MILLPTFQTVSSDYNYLITLEERSYKIRMTFNVRNQDWFITLEDFTTGQRIDGVRVVTNWPLFRTHRGQIQLRGDILCVPLSTAPSAIGYDGLGVTHNLVYMTATEVAQWRVDNGLG
jgi:hypothetical protein